MGLVGCGGGAVVVWWRCGGASGVRWGCSCSVVEVWWS